MTSLSQFDQSDDVLKIEDQWWDLWRRPPMVLFTENVCLLCCEWMKRLKVQILEAVVLTQEHFYVSSIVLINSSTLRNKLFWTIWNRKKLWSIMINVIYHITSTRTNNVICSKKINISWNIHWWQTYMTMTKTSWYQLF